VERTDVVMSLWELRPENLYQHSNRLRRTETFVTDAWKKRPVYGTRKTASRQTDIRKSVKVTLLLEQIKCKNNSTVIIKRTTGYIVVLRKYPARTSQIIPFPQGAYASAYASAYIIVSHEDPGGRAKGRTKVDIVMILMCG